MHRTYCTAQSLGRQGDKVTRRQGEPCAKSWSFLVSLSPCLLVSLSIFLLDGGLAQAQQVLPGLPGNALILPIDSAQVLTMSTKKPIRTVINQKDSVARVAPIPNRKDAVMITGLDTGRTRITMTDEAGMEESLDVIVQVDVDYLRILIRQAVPTANVEPLPSAGNTIVLTGAVARAQDVETIMHIAESMPLAQRPAQRRKAKFKSSTCSASAGCRRCR